MRTFILLHALASVIIAAEPDTPEGKVWIPGGTFAMGSELPGSRMDEKPVIKVTLDGNWIDACAVTNAQFRKFTEATAYKTVAERPIGWEEMKKQVEPGTPKPSDEQLQPGAVTFAPPPGPINPKAEETWWAWTHGASWKHPDGPASDLKGSDEHPVVMIAWEDAVASAKWANKRLPTEAEWEFAARGGLDGKRFAWGDDAGREFAHDRTDRIAKLDKGLDEAAAKDWTVVTMKDDWKAVFPLANPKP